MRKRTEPKFRLLLKLEAAGTIGMTKTDIARYLQHSTFEINNALQALLGERLIVQGADTSQGGGRRAMRFWHKDFAPDLTPKPPSDTSDPTLAESVPPGGTCQQCGRWTPMVLGKPAAFCGSDCAEMAKSGGVAHKLLLDQATDPFTYLFLCQLFVMADLSLRGYSTNLDARSAAPQILAYDARGAAVVRVVPFPRNGVEPDLSSLNSAALVYNDGRIRYGGKYPLVISEPKRENGEPVEESIEPSGAK